MKSRPFAVYPWALGALVALFAMIMAASAAPAAAGSTPPQGNGIAIRPAGLAAPATKTIVQSATLSTTGQDMFGNAAFTPQLTLFNETWNEGPDTFGDITGGCEIILEIEVCAEFGAAIIASVSGEIGMSIALEGFEDGTLSVTYPVTVTFTVPADNSFDPGAAVDIKTSMVVDSTNARIDSTFPGLDRVALEGILAFQAAASGKGCLFDCIEGTIFNIDERWEGEIFGLDQPSELNTCFRDLPLGFPWFLSTYPNDRCTNDKGYFFNPEVAAASTFNTADGTISATGQDQYAVIPVNVTPWTGQTFDLGLVTIGYTLFNATITAIETMKQDLLFDPSVEVNLDWGKSLGYKVLDGGDERELQNSSGTSATFKVGDTLRLTTNALNNSVIPITPTLLMGSGTTMANHTSNINSTDVTLSALAFTIGTPAHGTTDATADSVGPAYKESFPQGGVEESLFNGTFSIGGFNAPVLDSFNLVPRPIVEVRKDVVPANAPGLFNLKIDNSTVAADVGDAGTTGRIVLEPGTRVISETAGTAADLNFFDITITCVHFDGGAVHTQSAGASPGLGYSMNLVLTGGEDLVCTIKNRLPSASECDSMTFDNVILGTPGKDTLEGTNQRDMIIGYGGDDVIESGSGDDCVSGNAGNDRIELGAGNDVADGGTGDDQIEAGAGNDIVHGGTGNDRVQAGAGDDLVYAEDGDDVVSGGDGTDNIMAGAGNDTMIGGSDADTLDGGPGIDTAHGSSGVDLCIAEAKTNCER